MRSTRATIFQVHCETPFGADVRVVGSTGALGCWDVAKAVKLETGADFYPLWKLRQPVLLEPEALEYKFVVVTSKEGGDMDVRWESIAANRKLPPVVDCVQAMGPSSLDGRKLLIRGYFDNLEADRPVNLRAFPGGTATTTEGFDRLQGTEGLAAGGRDGTSYEEMCDTLASGGASKSVGDIQSLGSVETRASSTDSFAATLLTDGTVSPEPTNGGDDRPGGRPRALIWWQPHQPEQEGGLKQPPKMPGYVEVYGSFSDPVWEVPFEMYLCPEIGVWWLALEEALPALQPGTYEFKFRIDGQTWETNPALPLCNNYTQNNFLRIDYQLLIRIERRLPDPDRAPEQAPTSGGCSIVSSRRRRDTAEQDGKSPPSPGTPRERRQDHTPERKESGEPRPHVTIKSDGPIVTALRSLSGMPKPSSTLAYLKTPRRTEEERARHNAVAPEAQGSLDEDEGESATAGPQVAWRRAQSMAERLAEDGSPANPANSGGYPRIQSLGHIRPSKKAHQTPPVSPGGGVLYDKDVTLMLELPEAKRSTGLQLHTGAFCMPKRGTGEGEDAYFVESPGLGVADGVGGLQSALGVTSKAFADELMSRCGDEVRHHAESGGCTGLPSELCKKILCDAFDGIQSYGATTAAVTYFDAESNKLGMAILGDSGVMVIRRPTHHVSAGGRTDGRLRPTKGYVVFKSPPQQHEFNFPYQLCRLPKELSKLLICIPDKPSDCVTFDVDVEEGDLILVYSDGVDDNLHDTEILELCDRALSPYAAHVLGLPHRAATPSGLVARAVGHFAHLRSIDQTARTPFAEEARMQGWDVGMGGKQDDITCVAAWVACKSPSGSMPGDEPAAVENPACVSKAPMLKTKPPAGGKRHDLIAMPSSMTGTLPGTIGKMA